MPATLRLTGSGVNAVGGGWRRGGRGSELLRGVAPAAIGGSCHVGVEAALAGLRVPIVRVMKHDVDLHNLVEQLRPLRRDDCIPGQGRIRQTGR